MMIELKNYCARGKAAERNVLKRKLDRRQCSNIHVVSPTAFLRNYIKWTNYH